MPLKRTCIARNVAVMLMATTVACTAIAQRIPASSSDSGRRAVVVIDQASINNNINNAQNTANYAVNVGNAAQGTANWAGQVGQNAQRTADAATGGVLTSFKFLNATNGGTSIQGLCIRGWNPDGASQYVFARPCPDGSGPYVVAVTVNAGGQGE